MKQIPRGRDAPGDRESETDQVLIMTILKASIDAWGTESFSSVLKSELERLRSDVLPISHAIDEGNRLDDSDLGIIVNAVKDGGTSIIADVGVFFAQIVTCLTCSGGDGMNDEAYCELRVTIDKASGEAQFEPL
ncbi:MAG: glucosamine--fructose-6-phosphate aminotransferase [Candidatus Thiodiazotropha sp.]